MTVFVGLNGVPENVSTGTVICSVVEVQYKDLL